ncbi:LysE family translocator [uncultured Ruegeria sp.]|jgi:threonine/homoserine/homoserine lactone efflux protein|uniref:LysE family translocator n=1 Tax=uncultured Ruegeria sp. TaxID=259304 RepID=UPI00260999E0|nr:LysE family translocator [uncultured Ruegeria sp.]
MITSGFVAIWIAWLLAGGSPGPATMGIAGTAMNEGRTAGLAFALGICAGSAAWGIAAALGLSAIMLANVWVFEVIRYIGVAYLGWLALKALRRALTSDEVALGNPITGSLPTIFAKGAAIHLTNPKAILSWGSIYAIVAANDASLAMLLGYFGLLYAGSLLIFIGYAFLFSSARMVQTYRRTRRWFDFAFAGFFGLASYKILTVRLS